MLIVSIPKVNQYRQDECTHTHTLWPRPLEDKGSLATPLRPARRCSCLSRCCEEPDGRYNVPQGEGTSRINSLEVDQCAPRPVRRGARRTSLPNFLVKAFLNSFLCEHKQMLQFAQHNARRRTAGHWWLTSCWNGWWWLLLKSLHCTKYERGAF